ncbi:hypothetical protein [Prevotella amnii]|uniref:hypothetical protein n=1 Tax=Prevotella amnii TaxID=419005 RepID=UPI00030EB332|nr:hypothetical protein [Prevotella amnii]
MAFPIRLETDFFGFDTKRRLTFTIATKTAETGIFTWKEYTCLTLYINKRKRILLFSIAIATW